MTSVLIPVQLAATGMDLPELAREARSGPSSGSMVAIVLMAVLMVVLLVVLWAVFLRKPLRAAERGRLVAAKAKDGSSESGSDGRRRRRKRDHRGRNPTLAETGGLPQAKSSGQPPPTP